MEQEAALSDACDVNIWKQDTPPTYHLLMEKVAGIHGLLSLLTDRVDATLMDAAGPNLKIISNCAVGYDNIDIKAATDRGILVGNTPGILTETTADLAFALLMAAARRLVEGNDHIRAGKWKTFDFNLLRGFDIYGATLGIIGMGRIGKALARRGRGFDMNVIYYDHHDGPEKGNPVEARSCNSIDELLTQADFISIHTPLTSESYHMIDRQAFGMMKERAVLINTARGPIVDSEALYEALSSGSIASAALDVTDPEPLPPDHKLLTLTNCLIVPHIGSATIVTRNQMASMAVENLLAGVGKQIPPHLVNPEVLSRRR